MAPQKMRAILNWVSRFELAATAQYHANAMNEREPANPSRPSNMLIELTTPTMAKIVKGKAKIQSPIGLQPRRFPAEGGSIAKATGHPEDELDYSMASSPAHSAAAASLWHDRDGGPRGILAGGNDPAWTRHVAGRATRHMVRAAAAMASVCSVATTADLEAFRDEVETDLNSGRLPGPERV